MGFLLLNFDGKMDKGHQRNVLVKASSGVTF